MALAQVDDPAETIVVTEKWGSFTDSWVETTNGDLNVGLTTGRMALAANRHTGGLNCSFFDGHAKWMLPSDIDASKDLSGCGLVNRYPVISNPPAADDMCDLGDPGCVNTGPRNLCNSFPWQ